jgi:RecG-like helicase
MSQYTEKALEIIDEADRKVISVYGYTCRIKDKNLRRLVSQCLSEAQNQLMDAIGWIEEYDRKERKSDAKV